MPVPLLPLTPFQRVLRQWEQLCPQNSVQMMLVDGTLDPDAIESTWQATLREMGLGRVHVDEEQMGYSHEIWSGEPPAPLVSQLEGEFDPYAHIQSELNLPFPTSAGSGVMPYRPFAIQGSGACHLGLVYQQWVADSVSIRLLMREWFLRLFHPHKARTRLIELPRIKTALGPGIGMSPRQIVGAIKRCWRWWKVAKTLQGFTPGEGNYAVELRRFTLAPEQVHRLLMLTRAEGSTVNDLLIATLAAALQVEFPQGPIAIATSIDLRPYIPGDLSETFGSVLAYIPVICKLPAGNKLDLSQTIARQTRRMKDPEQIARYLMLPRLLAWLGRRSEGRDILKFYRRHAAVVASMANVNLETSWPSLYSPFPVRGYSRLASPNPAMPLSVSTTTFQDNMEVIVCSQRATLPPDRAQRLVQAFGVELQSLVQSGASK